MAAKRSSNAYLVTAVRVTKRVNRVEKARFSTITPLSPFVGVEAGLVGLVVIPVIYEPFSFYDN
jgi:hypothetical protein